MANPAWHPRKVGNIPTKTVLVVVMEDSRYLRSWVLVNCGAAKNDIPGLYILTSSFSRKDGFTTWSKRHGNLSWWALDCWEVI